MQFFINDMIAIRSMILHFIRELNCNIIREMNCNDSFPLLDPSKYCCLPPGPLLPPSPSPSLNVGINPYPYM